MGLWLQQVNSRLIILRPWVRILFKLGLFPDLSFLFINQQNVLSQVPQGGLTKDLFENGNLAVLPGAKQNYQGKNRFKISEISFSAQYLIRNHKCVACKGILQHKPQLCMKFRKEDFGRILLLLLYRDLKYYNRSRISPSQSSSSPSFSQSFLWDLESKHHFFAHKGKALLV